jgi:hypothetical protein
MLLAISAYAVFAVFLILIDFLVSKYTYYWSNSLILNIFGRKPLYDRL